jgi:hypothetical protein
MVVYKFVKSNVWTLLQTNLSLELYNIHIWLTPPLEKQLS